MCFVSYTQADRPWAEWMLEDAGFSAVLQVWDFAAGENFVARMQRASAEAKRTIAVLSPGYAESRWGKWEWTAALAEQRLLRVRVSDFDPAGLLMVAIHLDLVGLDEQAARARLLAEIERDRRRAKPTRQPGFPAGAIARAPAAALSGRAAGDLERPADPQPELHGARGRARAARGEPAFDARGGADRARRWCGQEQLAAQATRLSALSEFGREVRCGRTSALFGGVPAGFPVEGDGEVRADAGLGEDGSRLGVETQAKLDLDSLGGEVAEVVEDRFGGGADGSERLVEGLVELGDDGPVAAADALGADSDDVVLIDVEPDGCVPGLGLNECLHG